MARIDKNVNGHGHITETPDVSHIKNVDVTHEISDVNVSGILKFVAGLTIMTAVVFVLMLLLFKFLNSKKETVPGPMAMTEQERLPPEPRLQAAPGFGVNLEKGQWVNLQNREPQAEYRAVRDLWERQLKCKLRDEMGNLVSCMTIDDAMEKVREGKGLPSRPQANLSGKIDDYAVSMPTAASSGRLTEKSRQ